MPDERALNPDTEDAPSEAMGIPPPPVVMEIREPRRISVTVCLTVLVLLFDGFLAGLFAVGLRNSILAEGGNVVRWIGCCWNISGVMFLFCSAIGLILARPWSRIMGIISVHLTFTVVAVVVWTLSGDSARYRLLSLLMTSLYLSLALLTTALLLTTSVRRWVQGK